MNTRKNKDRLRPALFLLEVILAAIFLGVNISWAEGPKATQKYSIPNAGVLELNVLPSWKDQVRRPQENMPPVIFIKPAKGEDFEMVITITSGEGQETGFNNPDKVRALVQKEGEKLIPRAVETKIDLKELLGTYSIGYFFLLTDKAPKSGDYKYMTRGGIGVGNLLLNVTILHHVRDSESVKTAFDMLREVRQRKQGNSSRQTKTYT